MVTKCCGVPIIVGLGLVIEVNKRKILSLILISLLEFLRRCIIPKYTTNEFSLTEVGLSCDAQMCPYKLPSF